MSADPLAVHAPGQADLNLYAYVRGAALKATDPLGLQDAAYERYGENTWADQGFDDFAEGRSPAVERGATVVFDTETIIGGRDPGQTPPQWTGVYQNTPEGSPETKGMLLRKQAALDTGVGIGEAGLVVADLATLNLTPLPSAELALLRRADKVAEIGEALAGGRQLELGALRADAARDVVGSGDRFFRIPQSAGAARHPVYDRLEGALARHGGELVEGGAKFPTRRAARQAASEVAGDMGPGARAIRASEFRGGPRTWQKSNRVIGRESADASVLWRDDVLGHPRYGMGRHVNVEVEQILLHLFY